MDDRLIQPAGAGPLPYPASSSRGYQQMQCSAGYGGNLCAVCVHDDNGTEYGGGVCVWRGSPQGLGLTWGFSQGG